MPRQKVFHISSQAQHIAEEVLVRQLKAKDKGALEYLYDHYSGAIYGVILRIVKKEGVAEEVLQDVFLKIWDRIATYDAAKGKLFTWMINVARNQAIDKTRSREIIKDQKTGDIEKVVGMVERTDFVELHVESIGLSNVLKQLPEEQRFVVEYLYLKGYSQSELAKDFDIPLGTVKTRLRLGMQQLRTILGIK